MSVAVVFVIHKYCLWADSM